MRSFHLPRQLVRTVAFCLLTCAAAAGSSTATAATATAPDTASTDVLPGAPPRTPADGERLTASAKNHGVQMPAGWTATPLASVRGHIQTADTDDSGVVMYNDSLDLGAVVMVTFTPGGGYASILKTFRFDAANPPQLTLLEPGDYAPACHPGRPCEKVHSSNQAISLCFAEASCSILYYDGKQLRDVAMTD